MGEDPGFEGINPEILPTMKEVDEKLKEYLDYLYEEDLKKFVIRQGVGRYIILSKGYDYFPPIILTAIYHPGDKTKALFINIERKIPIENLEELIEITKRTEEMFNISLKEIRRKYGERSKEYKLLFVSISAKIHALTLRDPAWFFFLLSRLLKLDGILLGEKIRRNGVVRDSVGESPDYT